MIHLSISGTHSTGKTTILQDLKKELHQGNPILKNFQFIPGVTREANSLGLSINDKDVNYNDTQLFIVATDIRNLFQYRKSDYISDRCLFDTMVYSYYLFHELKISLELYQVIERTFKDYLSEYTKIIYLSPEFDLVDDGQRSVDLRFQERIEEIFVHFIKRYKLEDKIYYLKGTEDRTVKVLKLIKKLKLEDDGK